VWGLGLGLVPWSRLLVIFLFWFNRGEIENHHSFAAALGMILLLPNLDSILPSFIVPTLIQFFSP